MVLDIASLTGAQ